MSPLETHFEHLKIQLEAILSATNNFSDDNCIGKGGFGKVYKGELVHRKGQTVVALKRLNRDFGQGNPEFWREIIMLSLYKHENIVSLLGFSDESEEKVLVYEYASKGSLDLYLNSDDLTWIQRLNICIRAARGLAYLHNPGVTQQRVLHRDVKSSNILLDENWNAKISDLVYVESGFLTKESDVYSFGVVLFEILCGRLSINNNDSRRSLIRLVRQCYEQNKMEEIIYGNIKDEIRPNSLESFITIAYQCLKNDVGERPFMSKVVKVLENALRYQLGDANSHTDYDNHDEYMTGPSTQPEPVTDIMMIENKCVFKVSIINENAKKKAMKTLCDVSGVNSISMDMNKETLSITGHFDPVAALLKLRKRFYAEMISFCSAPKKKKSY